MKYQFEKYSESLIMWVVWLLPKSLIYWAAIRLHANATYVYSDRTPDQITIWEALAAWSKADAHH